MKFATQTSTPLRGITNSNYSAIKGLFFSNNNPLYNKTLLLTRKYPEECFQRKRNFTSLRSYDLNNSKSNVKRSYVTLTKRCFPHCISKVNNSFFSTQTEKEEHIDSLTILWGSQTGTAKSFAEDLHHQILDNKIFDKSNLKIFDLANFQNEKLVEEKLVIFLTSCYGEGEPTDNAKNFFLWLMEDQREKEKDQFKNVKFSIFGLGSSKAHRERYQVVGRYLDERLTELGAQKFFETGEGDDSEDIESDFETWKTNLLAKLEQYKPKREEESESSDPITSSYSIQYFDSSSSHSDIRIYDPNQEVGANNFYPSKLVESIEVCPKSQRSTKQIWMSIKGSKIEYEAGDYVCVLPKNSTEAVERAAQRLNVNLNSIFSVVEHLPNSLPLPLIRFKDQRIKVRKVLEEYADLQCFISPSILRSLTQFTPSQRDRDQLIRYSDPRGAFNEVKREKKGIVDVLLEFPSIHLPWLNFLEISPVIAPRYYSIASSSHQTKDLISIVCRRVTYHTHAGKYMQGLCSSYLSSLLPVKLNNVDSAASIINPTDRTNAIDKLIAHSAENATISIYLKPSSFRLPKDKLTPIILVAGGCGIAPFIGFIKEREYLLSLQVPLGPAYLFFGCRSENEMMFREYIESSVLNGVLTSAFLAYSEANPPVLVTDLLRAQSDLLYPLMSTAHIYMCGASFATAAYHSFCKIHTDSAPITLPEAEKIMKEMILDGRYHEDLQ